METFTSLGVPILVLIKYYILAACVMAAAWLRLIQAVECARLEARP